MKIAFFGLKDQGKEDYFREKLGDHELVFFNECLVDHEMTAKKDFDIISIFVGCQVTKKVIEVLPNLKMIAIRSAGFDNVDLEFAKLKRITISNVPSYSPSTVAEFAFGLILSLARHIPEAASRVREQGKFNYQGLLGINLKNKTIGVVGTGRIGAEVIRIAQGCGMKILAYDLYQNQGLSQELKFPYVSLEKLLSESDVVTLHVPSTKETFHLINQKNIGLMKKGALLINTARGSLIETSAVYQALKLGHLGGAGLDVLEDESKLHEGKKQETGVDWDLIKLPNVIITPHMAFYSKEAEEAIMQITIENINAFLLGSPLNVVG